MKLRIDANTPITEQTRVFQVAYNIQMWTHKNLVHTQMCTHIHTQPRDHIRHKQTCITVQQHMISFMFYSSNANVKFRANFEIIIFGTGIINYWKTRKINAIRLRYKPLKAFILACFVPVAPTRFWSVGKILFNSIVRQGLEMNTHKKMVCRFIFCLFMWTTTQLRD